MPKRCLTISRIAECLNQEEQKNMMSGYGKILALLEEEMNKKKYEE